MILWAHRAAARDEHDVRPGRAQGLAECVSIVGAANGLFCLGAVALQQGLQEHAVAVDDVGATGHAARRQKLIAGDEQSSARTAHHLELGHPHARQHTCVLRPQVASRPDDDAAKRNVLANCRDVSARAYASAGQHAGLVCSAQLWSAQLWSTQLWSTQLGHQDRVRSCGQWRSRGDGQRLTWRERALERIVMPGSNLADEPQRSGARLAGAHGRLGHHRVTIHHGSVEMGYGDPRTQLASGDAASCRRDGYCLAGQRAGALLE